MKCTVDECLLCALSEPLMENLEKMLWERHVREALQISNERIIEKSLHDDCSETRWEFLRSVRRHPSVRYRYTARCTKEGSE